MALACKFWRLKMTENPRLCGSFDGWSVVLVPAADAVMHRLQGYQRLLQAGGARVEVYDPHSPVNWVRGRAQRPPQPWGRGPRLTESWEDDRRASRAVRRPA